MKGTQGSSEYMALPSADRLGCQELGPHQYDIENPFNFSSCGLEFVIDSNYSCFNLKTESPAFTKCAGDCCLSAKSQDRRDLTHCNKPSAV